MQTYWRLLRENPEFAKLWLAQVISLTGDWFSTVVLSTLVGQFSNGSGLAVSIFLLARFLPSFILSPFAGVLVDRFNRRQLMVWSNALRALIVPLFLLAQSADQLWIIYLVTIVQFTLATVYEPAYSAILPALVKSDQLVEANTLSSVTWSVMLALGAALGGIFAALFGGSAALLADAATFLLAAGLTAWIRTKPIPTPLADAAPAHPENTSFWEGLRYVLRTPPMAAALFVKFGGSLGNVDTLMTILATQVFVFGNGGEITLGIFYSLFGLGAFLGPLWFNRYHDGSVAQMRRLIGVGFIAIVLGWLFLGGTSVFVLLCIGLFIRAIGGSVNWTYSTIIIQKTAPDVKLGRMFALDMAGFQLATVLSTLVHGALVDVVGIDHLWRIALATGMLSLLPLVFWNRVVFNLERRERVPVLD